MTDSPPSPPSDLRPRGRGRRLWRAVTADHDLRVDQLELLVETARLADQLDALRSIIEADGLMVDDGAKMHPAAVELRQLRLEFRRHLAQLSLPDPVSEPEEKPRPGDGIVWMQDRPSREEIRRARHNPRHGKRSRRKSARNELP